MIHSTWWFRFPNYPPRSRCSGSMTEPPSLYAWYLGGNNLHGGNKITGFSTPRMPRTRLETSQGHLSLGEQTPTSLNNFHSKHRAVWKPSYEYGNPGMGAHINGWKCTGTWGYFTYRGLMVNYNPHLQLVDGAQVGIFTDSHGTGGILGPGSMAWHESLPWHPFLIGTGKKTRRQETKKQMFNS